MAGRRREQGCRFGLAFRRRAVLIAALLFASTPSQGSAPCKGRDLFPMIEAQEPAAFAAIEAERAATPFPHGTLFRLSRDGQTSYVFGTLHLDDPRVASFRPSVIAALSSSKTLALESVETGARLLRSIRKDPAAMRAALLAPQDQRPDVLLDAADFAALQTLVAEAGLAASSAGALKPAVLALLLDLPACARKNGVKPYADEAIAELAKAQGARVVGLETMIEQIDILDGFSPEVGRALLVATLRQAGHAEDVVETTIARYALQDLGGLLAWMKSPELIPGVAGAQTPPDFLDRLITRRNQRMRDRAVPLLEKGGVFIAVGAAHLPGERGLLNLLELEGFRVEAVE